MEGLALASNRKNNLIQWYEAWHHEIRRENITLFLMLDSFDRSEKTEIRMAIPEANVYNHADVIDDLKDKSWIIPQKTSACKSFAIYKAWEADCENIYILDDDCYPSDTPFFSVHRIHLGIHVDNACYHTVNGIRPRGIPYLPKQAVVINHGLWQNIPDIDAITQIMGYGDITVKNGPVPIGALFPLCGMNVAFVKSVVPMMYFGLQGEHWKIDRFDDIWAGFIAKRILDNLNFAVMSGEPTINHIRASDPFTNIEKEASGYRMNCEFYNYVMNGFKPFGNSPIECMKSAGVQIRNWGKTNGKRYWQKYGEAIGIWAALFEEE